MKKTYRGSCHCGKVRIEADFDLSDGTFKCNCTSCTKSRAWLAIVKPDDFRIVSGDNELTDYRGGTNHYFFCSTCGIRVFGRGQADEIGGAFHAVNLGCLDDVDATELADAPVRYTDGRNDDWASTPAETRHL